MKRQFIALTAMAGVALLAIACSQDHGAAQNPGTLGGDNAIASAGPAFSVKELMDAIVDPAADGIWESVAVISDQEKGLEKRQPRTPEEWHAVKKDVIRLIESMNLITMPGRHAAPAGTARVPGELSSEEIDALLASEHETFIAFAKELQDTAGKALQAVEAKDAAALFKAGSEIDEACEACHQTFWYPNAK